MTQFWSRTSGVNRVPAASLTLKIANVTNQSVSDRSRSAILAHLINGLGKRSRPICGCYLLSSRAEPIDWTDDRPLWKELPQIAFWLLPSVIGAPIILYVLRRHPVIRRTNISP
jgi:hypothetical protein